jgi:hypothetical protein
MGFHYIPGWAGTYDSPTLAAQLVGITGMTAVPGLSQLSFDKSIKNIQWRKNSLFNTLCWQNCISIWKRMKLDPFFLSHTKISSKWIPDLNAKSETVTLLHENTGRTLQDTGVGHNVLHGILKSIGKSENRQIGLN